MWFMMTLVYVCFLALLAVAVSFYHSMPKCTYRTQLASLLEQKESATSEISQEKLKFQILQLGAALDRGQGFNPTSGDQYKGSMEVTKRKIEALIASESSSETFFSNEMLDGEWELVISTVPHGIFRSSPFFLAIQEAYAMKNQSDKGKD